MFVKIKKLKDSAVVPSYSLEGDAGLDLTATSMSTKFYRGSAEVSFVEYGTSLAIEIPNGYVGLIYPRSSVSKTKNSLCNAVAVIDSNYRGEIKLRFRTKSYHDTDMPNYEVGERIGQLIILPYPEVEFEVVDTLSDSDRGIKGFGASGK